MLSMKISPANCFLFHLVVPTNNVKCCLHFTYMNEQLAHAFLIQSYYVHLALLPVTVLLLIKWAIKSSKAPDSRKCITCVEMKASHEPNWEMAQDTPSASPVLSSNTGLKLELCFSPNIIVLLSALNLISDTLRPKSLNVAYASLTLP